MFLACFEPQIGALLEYHLGAAVMAPDDDSYFRRAIYYVVAMFLGALESAGFRATTPSVAVVLFSSVRRAGGM